MKARDEKKRSGAAGRALGLPPDIRPEAPTLDMVCPHELVIHSHEGIMEYTDKTIVVSCGSFLMRVTGFDLTIRAMNANDLALRGDIKQVEFI